MFGSNTLEVAIGIIFIFILVSTIVSALREGVEAWLKTRADYLEQGIRQLLNDPTGTGLAKSFYDHPLINGLYNSGYKPGKNSSKPAILAKGNNLPSYIPSKNFAVALLDIAAHGPDTSTSNNTGTLPVVSLASMRQNVAKIQNPAVQRVLLSAIDTSQGDMNKAQAYLETWYNGGMDRVSGWYKRSSQWIILWIALLVTLVLNVNTISIANYLIGNDSMRKAIVERAAVISKDTTYTNKNFSEANKQLDSLKLPIGWANGFSSAVLDTHKHSFWNYYAGPLIGWLLTALAACLGAPFWFDMLNKVMIIRSTIKPYEKSGADASKDGQAPDIQKMLFALQPQSSSSLNPNVNTGHNEADGCGPATGNLTKDENLPQSEGGLA